MKEATEKVSLGGAGWSQVAREGLLVSETCGGQGGTQRAQSHTARAPAQEPGEVGASLPTRLPRAARPPGFRGQPALVCSSSETGSRKRPHPTREHRGTRLVPHWCGCGTGCSATRRERIGPDRLSQDSPARCQTGSRVRWGPLVSFKNQVQYKQERRGLWQRRGLGDLQHGFSGCLASRRFLRGI